MVRSHEAELVAMQAVKYTEYENFRQLAVAQMVRILALRGQPQKAASLISEHESVYGASSFTQKLRAVIL